jgi:hypothetical protein
MPTEEELQEEEDRKRERREARQSRRRIVKPLLPVPEQRGPTAMESEGAGSEQGSKHGSNLKKAGRKGVQKKRRQGKGFLVGTKAAFHPKKGKGKKRQ